MTRHKLIYQVAAVLPVTLMPALPAHAQSAATPAASPAPQDDGISDVVVYGQRRAVGEQAQKVPIAVTALDESVLRSTNSVSIADIGGLAPNVQTTPLAIFPGFPKFSIRGIGVNASIRSLDPTINIIQDGMVIAYQAGAIASTFDLESLEILRGPQGVLFGRNATGGAIVLRTRLPRDRFGLLADVSYGNFNSVDANVSVEGPLGTDNLLGKVAVLYRSNTGMIRNTNDGIFVPAKFNPTGAPSNHPTGYVGGIDELTIKPTILIKFSDKTKLTLFTQYQRYNDDGSIGRNYQPAGGVVTQSVTDYGYTPTTTGYTTNIGDVGYVRLREGHVIGELDSEIGPGLLTATAAYRHITYDSTSNISATPFVGSIFLNNVESNSEENGEARYNVSLAHGLDLTVGGFYLRSTIDVLENRQSAGPRGAAVPNVFTQGQFHQVTNSFAGFANLDWAIVDQLKLSVGGRFSDEKKAITYAPLARCPGQSNVGCPQTFLTTARRWRNFSPRVVLSYTPADRILVYASYTQGFRSGNYNPRTTDLTGVGVGPANPETANAYELGVKTDLFDRRVRFNVALYQNDYDDLQQVLTVPGNAILQALLNAANARIRGIETELTLKPVRSLELNGNLGWTDAKYLKFNAIVPGVADPTTLRIANIPEWTAYGAVTYTYPGEIAGGSVNARLSYDWRSKVQNALDNTAFLGQRAYGLTNANISFARSNWSASLFARNLFNVYYTDNHSLNFAYVAFGGQPRTYGIRLTYRL